MSVGGESARLVGKQVAIALIALLLSSFLVFSALYVAPGNTITFLSGGRTLSPEAIETLNEEYRLDEPFFERYGHWLGDVAQGDFGRSIVSRAEVGALIGPRVGTTLLLMIMAGVITIVGGVLLGMLAGLSGTRTRNVVNGAANFAMAIPAFVLASLLIALFAVSLGWFPTFGSGSGLFDQIYHLFLPSIALALGGAAYIGRVAAVSIEDAAASEYVETARARGIPRSAIVRRHVLRNAMIPIATVAGITFAGLIATSVVVESAFGLDGLGSLLVQSVLAKDFAVVQAISLILVAGFLVTNLVVDLLYLRLDPRLRGKASA
ncbi:MAG: ABC transporter permease [Solirubrobacterales bacterium]